MNDRPLALLTHPESNRLHQAAAVRGAIAGFIVEVAAEETEWAMIPMRGTCARPLHLCATLAALEARCWVEAPRVTHAEEPLVKGRGLAGRPLLLGAELCRPLELFSIYGLGVFPR